MTDILTRQDRSALMSRIRGVDTQPELFVRRALHALGYRFRTHVRGLPGRPDVVFSRRRAAVFVHGCFWHRHGCGKTYTPKSREQFWEVKFAGNVKRDRRNQQRLATDGWRVFIAWECEIQADETFMDRLVAFLGPPHLALEHSEAGRADELVAEELENASSGPELQIHCRVARIRGEVGHASHPRPRLLVKDPFGDWTEEAPGGGEEAF